MGKGNGFKLNFLSLGDMIFVLLPFLFLALTKAKEEGSWLGNFFHSADFGVAAVIIYGQGLVKYFSLTFRLKEVGRNIDMKRAVFLIVVLVALIFMSLIVMMLVGFKIFESSFIYYVQLLFFLISVWVHFMVGYYEEEIDELVAGS